MNGDMHVRKHLTIRNAGFLVITLAFAWHSLPILGTLLISGDVCEALVEHDTHMVVLEGRRHTGVVEEVPCAASREQGFWFDRKFFAYEPKPGDVVHMVMRDGDYSIEQVESDDPKPAEE